LLLIAFAAAGTEAMGHIYRTTLQQLLARQDLAMLAGQDGLTGLPNRTLLRARLNEGIVRIRRGNTVLAFHCLDLDHFKSRDRGTAIQNSISKIPLKARAQLTVP
jgi:diguanylate cyclase